MVTFVAKVVSATASSSAEFPPPTTTTLFPVKNSPSQVAQYEMPRPLNWFSPGMFKERGFPPGVNITERPLKIWPSSSSMVFISPSSPYFAILMFDFILQPKLFACIFMVLARIYPLVSGTPGKFAISSVNTI